MALTDEKLEVMVQERMKEGHVCIRIFEDDSVFITDNEGNILPEKKPPTTDPIGPRNTYDQALWYTGSPICIWYRGKRR